MSAINGLDTKPKTDGDTGQRAAPCLQAAATIVTGRAANQAWKMLRLNANVRSVNRTMSGSVRRSSTLLQAHQPGRERLQDPSPEVGLQDEAADAIAHCVPPVDVLANSDGYLTSAPPLKITRCARTSHLVRTEASTHAAVAH